MAISVDTSSLMSKKFVKLVVFGDANQLGIWGWGVEFIPFLVFALWSKEAAL